MKDDDKVFERKQIREYRTDREGFQNFLDAIDTAYSEGFRLARSEDVNNYTRATYNPFTCTVYKPNLLGRLDLLSKLSDLQEYGKEVGVSEETLEIRNPLALKKAIKDFLING